MTSGGAGLWEERAWGPTSVPVAPLGWKVGEPLSPRKSLVLCPCSRFTFIPPAVIRAGRWGHSAGRDRDLPVVRCGREPDVGPYSVRHAWQSGSTGVPS